MDPVGQAPKDFAENSLFWINQEFSIIKNGKIQRRGKVSTEMIYYFFFALKKNIMGSIVIKCI